MVTLSGEELKFWPKQLEQFVILLSKWELDLSDPLPLQTVLSVESQMCVTNLLQLEDFDIVHREGKSSL